MALPTSPVDGQYVRPSDDVLYKYNEADNSYRTFNSKKGYVKSAEYSYRFKNAGGNITAPYLDTDDVLTIEIPYSFKQEIYTPPKISNQFTMTLPESIAASSGVPTVDGTILVRELNGYFWTITGSLLTARFHHAAAGNQDAALAFGGTGSALPVQVSTEKFDGSSWTTNGAWDLNNANYTLAGAGTQTAGLAIGGTSDLTTPIAATEKFDGSTWTTNAGWDLNTPRFSLAGIGIQTAALSFGGDTGSGITNATEKFDGTTWSTSGNYGLSASYPAGAGIQTAGLGFGGLAPSFSTNTYKFDGSVWTSAGNLNETNSFLAGAGEQNAGLAFGGIDGSVSGTTERYDGSSWSIVTYLNVSRSRLAGAGITQTSALSIGGRLTATQTGSTEKFNESDVILGLYNKGQNNADYPFGVDITINGDQLVIAAGLLNNFNSPTIEVSYLPTARERDGILIFADFNFLEGNGSLIKAYNSIYENSGIDIGYDTENNNVELISQGDKNLIAYYKFDNLDSSDVVKNSSGITSDATKNNFSGSGSTAGQVKEAISFDGTNYIDLPSDVCSYFTGGSDSISVSIWVKFDNLSSSQTLLSVSYDSGLFFIDYNTLFNSIRVSHTDGTGGLSAIGAVGSTPVLEWIHVVATWDKDTQTLSLYQDGEFIDSDNSDSVDPENGISGTIGSPFQNLEGDIDEVRIYNRVLSLSEIQTIRSLELENLAAYDDTKPLELRIKEDVSSLQYEVYNREQEPIEKQIIFVSDFIDNFEILSGIKATIGDTVVAYGDNSRFDLLSQEVDYENVQPDVYYELKEGSEYILESSLAVTYTITNDGNVLDSWWAIGADLISAKDDIVGAGSQKGTVILGGDDGGTPLVTTDIFNGSTWTTNGAWDLNTQRRSAASAGSQNEALCFGGFDGSVGIPDTEKFDGSSWSTNGAWDLNTGRSATPGGVGSQNAALTFGGYDVSVSRTEVTEKFNGSSWTTNGTWDLNIPRYDLGSAGSQNAALCFGGVASGGETDQTEKFDGNSWIIVNSLISTARENSGWGTQNIAFSSGGLSAPNQVEKFNGNAWSITTSLNIGRKSHGSTGFKNSGMVFGGEDVGYIASTELFQSNNSFRAFKDDELIDIVDNEIELTDSSATISVVRNNNFSGGSWTLLGANLSASKNAVGSAGNANAALCFGGQNTSNNAVNTTEKFDGSAWSTDGTWNLITQKYYLAGTGEQNAALTFGGFNGSVNFDSTEKFNGNSWTINASWDLSETKRAVGAAGIQNAALAFGGFDGSSTVTTTEIFNGSSWTLGNPLNVQNISVGTGTQNAALSVSNNVEKYDGTNWFVTAVLNTVRQESGVSGTQNEALAFGGIVAPSSFYDNAEKYNGFYWIITNPLNEQKHALGDGGTQNSSIAFGGGTGLFPANKVSSTELFNYTPEVAAIIKY